MVALKKSVRFGGIKDDWVKKTCMVHLNKSFRCGRNIEKQWDEIRE